MTVPFKHYLIFNNPTYRERCVEFLKDHRGRQLSYDDLTHYQPVVVAFRKR